jgi:hypothetical protein
MKKLRMVVACVIILAIVSCAFAFKAKSTVRWCYSSVFCGNCVISSPLKKVPVGTIGSIKRYYVVDWDGGPCTAASECCEPAGFLQD